MTFVEKMKLWCEKEKGRKMSGGYKIGFSLLFAFPVFFWGMLAYMDHQIEETRQQATASYGDVKQKVSALGIDKVEKIMAKMAASQSVDENDIQWLKTEAMAMRLLSLNGQLSVGDRVDFQERSVALDRFTTAYELASAQKNLSAQANETLKALLPQQSSSVSAPVQK